MDIFKISAVATLGRAARRYRVARAESRANRIIGALPRNIRKDIGWPDCGPAWYDARSDRGWTL